MDLNEFIYEMAEGMIDELRDSPAGQALRNLLRPPPRPRAPRAPRMNPPPGPRAARARKQKGPAAAPPKPQPTAKQIAIAACTIAHYSGRNPAELIESPEMLKQAAREASKRTHPDNRDTGDADAFRKVIEAKEVLKIV